MVEGIIGIPKGKQGFRTQIFEGENSTSGCDRNRRDIPNVAEFQKTLIDTGRIERIYF